MDYSQRSGIPDEHDLNHVRRHDPPSAGRADYSAMTASQFASNMLAPPNGPTLSASNPWQSLDQSAHRGREEYAFRNFWSVGGRLDEVLFALPSKEQADVLISAFFKYVDPLYPIMSENLFRSRSEEFWALAPGDRGGFDTTWVALQFIVFASGHLYVHDPTAVDFMSLPETYLSCCYRALCLVSFLSEWSLEAIQVLILICNYFVTNTRVADCWTFSGILQKLVYGLDLHRAPPTTASMSEKHLRYSLWQAFMFQDVSLSYYLELVPASCHHTIDVILLQPVDDGDNNPNSRLQELLLEDSSRFDVAFLNNKADVAYQRAMWQFSEFMQTNICLPAALGQSIVTDSTHKLSLLADLQSIRDNLDVPFNSTDSRGQQGRVWRQMVMIASNYNFAFTMIHLAQNAATNVSADTGGALKSSNKGMSAFFDLVSLDRQYLRMWTPANVRAYAQTLMICKALAAAKEHIQGRADPWMLLAVANFERYVDLLRHAQGSSSFELKKQESLMVLSEYREVLLTMQQQERYELARTRITPVILALGNGDGTVLGGGRSFFCHGCHQDEQKYLGQAHRRSGPHRGGPRLAPDKIESGAQRAKVTATVRLASASRQWFIKVNSRPGKLEADLPSCCNVDGQEVAVRLAKTLVAAGVAQSDIGIISMYSDDCVLIKRELELGGVQASSVDAFQVHEKRVIILHFVAAFEPENPFRFVSNAKRLCIATSAWPDSRVPIAVGWSELTVWSRSFLDESHVMQNLWNTMTGETPSCIQSQDK